VTVVVPAGLPILDAARWVGASCWLELAAHRVLTAELADPDLSDSARVARWRVRAHRAEVAAAWHERLPELREFPRERFVAPPADPGPDPADRWWEAGASIGPVDVLDRLDRRYRDHEAVAVGPADGPVRATLSRARELLAADRPTLAGRPLQ
jgi:hypothetical protein